MITKKTDNANLHGKLALRRYFLDRYPCSSVIDCCQGDQVIWSQLRQEYPVEKYLGVDLKEKKGRLKIDSNRILAQPGWTFDCIDIDTYGSPWAHWESILQYSPHSITVFLTVGLVKVGGGRVSNEIMRWLGFSGFSPKIPSSLASKCMAMAIPYCLARATRYEFTIVEAKAAPPSKNAEYYGIRLDK